MSGVLGGLGGYQNARPYLPRAWYEAAGRGLQPVSALR